MQSANFIQHENYETRYGIPLFKKSFDSSVFYLPNQGARNLVKWLFSEQGFELSLIDSQLVKCLFWKKDPKVFNDFKAGIQEVLDSINYHLNNDNPRYQSSFLSNKNLQLDIVKSFAISMYTFTEPENGESLNIPTDIMGKWQMVTYKVNKIQMTSCYHGSPYYAYGLEPEGKHQDKAPALLVFMGTNPIPTASGVRHTFAADLRFRKSIGEHLYDSGKEALQLWINQNCKDMYGKKRLIIAYGQSLGGSLAVITHINNPGLVQAKAVNPPAWLKKLKNVYEQNKKQQGLVDNPITIYTQKQDPVFQILNWIPEDSDVYHIDSVPGRRDSYLAKHKDCFATHNASNGLFISKINPGDENSRFSREMLTLLKEIISLPATAIFVIIDLLKVLIHKIINLGLDILQKTAVLNESAVKYTQTNYQCYNCQASSSSKKIIDNIAVNEEKNTYPRTAAPAA